MAKQRDRDEFIAIMAQEGVPVDVARKLLRAEATLHRLAELSCSSEAADSDRVPCPDTGKAVNGCLCRDYGSGEIEGTNGHGDVPRIAVQEARIQARVSKLLQPYHVAPIYNGDPRAAILLTVPSGRTNDWGQRGICVP